MSIHIIDAVFRTNLPAQRKLILLALADNANDSGFCWPNQETIAAKASISTRNLRTHLHALAAEGWLEVVSLGNGRGKSSEYLLSLAKIKAEKADAGAEKADAGAEKADAIIRPTVIEPSVFQPSVERPPQKQNPVDDDFVLKMAAVHPLVNVPLETKRALAHPAAKNKRDLQRYVANWLGRASRDAEDRRAPPRPMVPIGQTPVLDWSNPDLGANA